MRVFVIQIQQRLMGWVLIALVCLLQACASSPYSTENKTRSDAQLAAQIAQLKTVDPSAPARLFVLAAGLHDQSLAFRGDVDTFVAKITELNKNAAVLKLVNPAPGQPTDLPYATQENLSLAVSEMAAAMRPQDKAVLLLTTHGSPSLLAVNAGGQAYPPLSSAQLKNILKPLESHDHGLVVSACFSGSLIPELQQNNRWILTAAAADRKSFGCQFNGRQTYFIDALLGQAWTSKTAFRDLFQKTRQSVQARETRENLTPPSNPQIDIPAKYKDKGPLTLGELLVF